MPGVEGRERALDLFEKVGRGELLARIRETAHRLYRTEQRPLSTNDVRFMLEELGYEGDPRILGAVFRGWHLAGWTTVDSKLANARPIRTFIPPEGL